MVVNPRTVFTYGRTAAGSDSEPSLPRNTSHEVERYKFSFVEKARSIFAAVPTK